MMVRILGRSGIEISGIGFGCWAIGGPFSMDGRPDGWGQVDDGESVAAVRRAVELGITFFDTADVYGAGHSEEVLGRALAGHRDEVVIATKFGYTFDRGQRAITGEDVSHGYIRRACQASLRRLGTDRIDLYQLHVGDLTPTRAQEALHPGCPPTTCAPPSRGWATSPAAARHHRGMPIAQMQKYAELSCGGQATLAERMSLLTEHGTHVKERIALLQAQHDYLQDKIAWYRTQIATVVPDEAMSTAPGAGTSGIAAASPRAGQ